MRRSPKRFERMKYALKACIENRDPESAHSEADEILREVALCTYLTKQQREELVDLYDKVYKWYA